MSNDKETTWPTLEEIVGGGFPHGEVVRLHTSYKSALLLPLEPVIYIDFEASPLPLEKLLGGGVPLGAVTELHGYSRADAAVSSSAFQQVASLLAKDPEEDA